MRASHSGCIMSQDDTAAGGNDQIKRRTVISTSTAGINRDPKSLRIPNKLLFRVDAISPCDHSCSRAPKHRPFLPIRLTPITPTGDPRHCFPARNGATINPVDGNSSSGRKANETHWHAVGRGKSTPLLSPRHLGKAGRRGPSLGEPPSTSAAAPVEALDERRLGFSTRRPGQGRKGFECQPPPCSPCRGKVLLRDSLLVPSRVCSSDMPGFVYTESTPCSSESNRSYLNL